MILMLDLWLTAFGRAQVKYTKLHEYTHRINKYTFRRSLLHKKKKEIERLVVSPSPWTFLVQFFFHYKVHTIFAINQKRRRLNESETCTHGNGNGICVCVPMALTTRTTARAIELKCICIVSTNFFFHNNTIFQHETEEKHLQAHIVYRTM